MDNFIVLMIIASIVALAIFFIFREKKRGNRCIGCPDAKTCRAGGCKGCCGCPGKCDNTK